MTWVECAALVSVGSLVTAVYFFLTSTVPYVRKSGIEVKTDYINFFFEIFFSIGKAITIAKSENESLPRNVLFHMVFLVIGVVVAFGRMIAIGE